jgi:hypothetical protein
MRVLVVGFALMLSGGAARAEGICDFRAYTHSVPPAQVAIHAEPSAQSAVLGMAPVEPPGSDLAEFGPEFRILEMRNGWAKVTDVTSFLRTETGPDGWIDGREIAFIAQTEIAFTAPNATSDPVWSGENWPYPTAVLDCEGEWAKITFEDFEFVGSGRVIKGLVTGWVRGVCPAQETSCEGLFGDRRP